MLLSPYQTRLFVGQLLRFLSRTACSLALKWSMYNRNSCLRRSIRVCACLGLAGLLFSMLWRWHVMNSAATVIRRNGGAVLYSYHDIHFDDMSGSVVSRNMDGQVVNPVRPLWSRHWSKWCAAEALVVSSPVATSDVIGALDSFRSLRRVQVLGKSQFDAKDWHVLQTQSDLEYLLLAVSGERVDDSLLKMAAHWPRLKCLWLCGSNCTDAGLKSLVNHPAIESLQLDGAGITDSGIRALAGVPKLGNKKGISPIILALPCVPLTILRQQAREGHITMPKRLRMKIAYGWEYGSAFP